MIDYADDLRSTVTRVSAHLHGLPESAVARRPTPGKWSTKEILGHLIDSAANNHARFVRALFVDDLICSGYAQEEWVAAQRYQESAWPALADLWRDYNLHEVAWQSAPADAPATLDYFMRDYVGHLHHHLRQIDALVGGVYAGR